MYFKKIFDFTVRWGLAIYTIQKKKGGDDQKLVMSFISRIAIQYIYIYIDGFRHTIDQNIFIEFNRHRRYTYLLYIINKICYRIIIYCHLIIIIIISDESSSIVIYVFFFNAGNVCISGAWTEFQERADGQDGCEPHSWHSRFA